MSSNKKAIRQIVGYTFAEVGADPTGWFDQAQKFNTAANLLYDQDSLLQVCLHVAGLSLELGFKAILIAKSKSLATTHTLVELASQAGVTFSADQECTLELLAECIIWRGRYPTPKSENHWDRFHDKILEKHIIHKQDGNVYSTLVHKQRFPTQDNYQAIWIIVEREFNLLVKNP